MTGRLTQIWRHPIKGHGAETLTSTPVVAGKTMPWDRVWAVTHEATKVASGEWASCMNFARGASAPHLMALRAKLDETTETVTLSHPDLDDLTFRPDDAGDVDRFLKWVSVIMPEGRVSSTGIIRATGQGLTDSSSQSISLGNLATLRVLEDHAGRPLDVRRFRINLWVEGLAPFEELEWLEKTVQVGDVTFHVRDHAITRCAATKANPDTGKRDTDTLTLMREHWGHEDLGITMIAENSGQLALNDGATLT